MQMFDKYWKQRLVEQNITTNLLIRYMDDARAFLPAFHPGWRYTHNGLEFCNRWRIEDKHLSPTERTKRVLAGTMVGIEDCLDFTFETCEDEGFNGWLPTLDTQIQIGEDNQIYYKYFEKDTCSKRTVQARTAMNENTKIQILSNDTVRRLLTTREDLGAGTKGAVIDQYAVKLLHSGYSREQTRKILKNGIKGYLGRMRNREQRGLKLRSTAWESRRTRYVGKLLDRTGWYRRRNKGKTDVTNKASKPGSNGRRCMDTTGEQDFRTVMFVEYTKNGELAKRMRELISRLENVIGFKVKVVERAGASLKSLFPTNNLWEGQKCGRADCTTCEQGAEMLPNCTKSSLLYENICGICNPKAGEDKELVEVNQDIPTLYVGETSRSIYERSKEHWGAWRGKSDKSHIWKHQVDVHGGAPPKFYMRVVRFYKTALSRQIGEAVRIRRRGGGGSILNSKAEFDRCKIPRLVVEEQEEEPANAKEEQERKDAQEQILEEQIEEWGSQKLQEREQIDKAHRSKLAKITERNRVEKREQELSNEGDKKRRKKLKFRREEEDWGMMGLPSTDIRERLVDHTTHAPLLELPPLEQRRDPRRSRQRLLKELIPPASAAPKGTPPEPAGTILNGVLNSGSLEPPNPIENHEMCPAAAQVEPGWKESSSSVHKKLEQDGKDGSRSSVEQKNHSIVTPSTTKGVNYGTDNVEKEEGNVVVTPPGPLGGGEEPRGTGDDDLGDGGGVSTNDLRKCEFKRGGMCKTHQIIGQKIVIPSVEWRKDKSGLYKYVKTQKTKYICKVKSLSNEASNISTSADSQELQDLDNTSGLACREISANGD